MQRPQSRREISGQATYAQTWSVLAAAAAALAAQPARAQFQFQETIGGTNDQRILDAVRATDGGYVTVGVRSVVGGPRDIMLTRHNPDGSFFVPWGAAPKLVVGAGDDVGYSVTRTFDGGYVVGAETNSMGAALGLGLLKFNAAGVLLAPGLVFTATPFVGGRIGAATYELADNSLVVTGRLRVSAGTGQEGVLSRVSPAGVPVFARGYFDAAIGLESSVDFADVRQMLDGRIAVCGSIANALGGPRDALIAWFDLAGNPLGAVAYGSPNTDEHFDSLEVLGDNTIALTGRDSTIASGSRFMRVSPAGAILSSRELKDFFSPQSCVREDSQHQRLIIGGSHLKTAAAGTTWAQLINCDWNGADIVTMLYGSPVAAQTDSGEAALATPDCGYALFGATNSFGVVGVDQYFVKTAANLHSGCNERPIDQSNPATNIARRVVQLDWFALQWGNWTPGVTNEYTRNVLCFDVICRADFDGDGFVTGTDFDQFVVAFEAGSYLADFDCDGFITGADYDLFVLAFEAGC